MGRQTDFGDKTIKKGFGPDKEKKLSVKEGQVLLVRVVSKLEEYLSHAIHDVLPPKRDQKTGANIPSIFNANCGRGWSEKDDDYVGACKYHDLEYDVTERYVGGVMLLGMLQGKTVIPLSPSDCGRFWDMTAGRVAELRKVIQDKFPEIETAEEVGNKLRQTTLKLSLKDEGGAETYQKLDIKVWEGQKLAITDDHKNAYRADIPAILKEVSAPSTPEEQERRLKKKATPGAPAAAAPGQAPEQEEDNLDDLDLDGAAAPAAAAPAKPRATRAAPAKPAPAKATPAPAPAPAEDDLGDLGGEEPAAEETPNEPAPPPAKAKAAAAPAAAKQKAAVATAAAGKKASDAAVDSMLDGLEDVV
jgi:hypothetical protein